MPSIGRTGIWQRVDAELEDLRQHNPVSSCRSWRRSSGTADIGREVAEALKNGCEAM